MSNARGTTPLAFAATKNFADIAEELVAGGALVDKKSENLTPLLWAVIGGNVAMVDFLAAHGASLKAGRSGGASPLTVALRTRRIEVVQALLRHGADPNERDTDGQTPIEYAIAQNLGEIIHILKNAADRELGPTADGPRKTASSPSQTIGNALPVPDGRVGIVVDSRADGSLVVKQVIAGFPAAAAGISAGDALLLEDRRSFPSAVSPYAQAAARIVGLPGTALDLTLQRGDAAPSDYHLLLARPLPVSRRRPPGRPRLRTPLPPPRSSRTSIRPPNAPPRIKTTSRS